MSTKNTALGAVLLVALSAFSAHDLLAQQTRWQVSGGLSTGGFSSNLYTDAITTRVVFPIGQSDPQQVTINDSYSFDSFVGFYGSAEWRRDHLGVWGSLSWLPTRTTAVDPQGVVPARIARALGYDVEGDGTANVPIRLKTSQNLFIPTVGVTYYSDVVPAPGRSSPPLEYYVSGGIGVVKYLDDDPLLVNAGDDLSGQPADAPTEWDTPVLGTLGAGLFVNITGSYGLRVEMMGSFWKTEIWGESNTQMSFTFRPAFVLIL